MRVKETRKAMRKCKLREFTRCKGEENTLTLFAPEEDGLKCMQSDLFCHNANCVAAMLEVLKLKAVHIIWITLITVWRLPRGEHYHKKKHDNVLPKTQSPILISPHPCSLSAA